MNGNESSPIKQAFTHTRKLSLFACFFRSTTKLGRPFFHATSLRYFSISRERTVNFRVEQVLLQTLDIGSCVSAAIAWTFSSSSKVSGHTHSCGAVLVVFLFIQSWQQLERGCSVTETRRSKGTSLVSCSTVAIVCTPEYIESNVDAVCLRVSRRAVASA